jgi:hypothetical protein
MEYGDVGGVAKGVFGLFIPSVQISFHDWPSASHCSKVK